MSSIGKIFIVVNLALSALALGWAMNHLETADNYKKDLEAANAQHATALADKDSEIGDLTNELNTVKTARGQDAQELAAVTADRDRLQSELTREQDRANQMQSELGTMTASLADYASTNDNLQAAEQSSQPARRSRLAATRSAQAAAEQGQRDADSARAEAEDTIAGLEREVTSAMPRAKLEIDLQALIEHTGVRSPRSPTCR